MQNRLLRAGLAAGLAFTAAIGISACGDSNNDSNGASQSTEVSESNSDSGNESGVEADLVLAKETIDKAIAEKGEQPSFYLASDVKSPEQKYGMWVLPYIHSDATSKVTEVVNIDGGKYEIVAVSAETEREYVINQDGKISEK